MSTPQNRTPPHSAEAEEQLLSACLIDGVDVVARCVNAQISPAAFYVPANRVIFATLLDLHSSDKPLELFALAEELKTRKQLDEVGGYGYLTRISDRAPTTASAALSIERVRDLANLRACISACAAAVERCYGWTGETLPDLIKPTTDKLLDLASGTETDKELDWNAVVDAAEVKLNESLAAKGKSTAQEVAFPWPSMNSLFGPMQRSQLVIIAARASVGKSSLARPILAHAARAGLKSYYVTLEVNPEKIPLQIASSMAGIGLRQAPMAHVADQRQLVDALRSLKGYGITITRRDRSIARIEARARALHARGQLDVLFIDHGGYIQDISNAVGEKRDVIGMVTKRLKTLAVELNVVVVLLWQLNRDSAKAGANREPTLTDLKDSGSLEEDADKVLLIHRPDEDGITRQPQSTTSDASECPRFFQNIIQAKGRDDGTSLLSFYFHRATATFQLATKQ